MTISKKNVALCRTAAARRRTKNRCTVPFRPEVSHAMAMLEAVELDPLLYVALALDLMSDTNRPKGQLNRRMARFCTYPGDTGRWDFASLFSEPGIFTTDHEAMREDLVVHGIAAAETAADIDLEAALRQIPAYHFPGMGPVAFVWTPHLRALLARR